MKTPKIWRPVTASPVSRTVATAVNRVSRLLLLSLLSLASCATTYQRQSLAGGFSDYLTAPDEAIVMFHGNGYTSIERVIATTALRCAEVTLAHGYRYFV